MSKKILAIILCITMFVFMAACSTTPGGGGTPAPAPPAPGTPAATADPSDRPVRIGLVTQSQGNPFHIQLRQAAVAYAEERGIEIVVLAAESLEEQLRVMEDLAQTRPDAIAVSAFDAAAIVTAIEAAQELGV